MVNISHFKDKDCKIITNLLAAFVIQNGGEVFIPNTIFELVPDGANFRLFRTPTGWILKIEPESGAQIETPL